MTGSFAIITASVLHLVFRMSFFLHQNTDQCSPAPMISSLIFVIAFLDILSDLTLFPVRYMHMPHFCQVIAETVMTVMLIEFGSLIVWCSLEKMCCRVVKSCFIAMGMQKCDYSKWERYITGIVTTSLSLLILMFAGRATDHFAVIRKKIKNFYYTSRYYLNRQWCRITGGNNDSARTKCYSSNNFPPKRSRIRRVRG